MRAQHVEGIDQRLWIRPVQGKVSIWIFDAYSAVDEKLIQLSIEEAQKLLTYLSEAIDEATFQELEERHAPSP